jgi:hypothetical protein
MTVVPLVNCDEAPPDTVQSCFVAPCPVYTWRISPHWGPCQARHSVRPPPLPVKSVRAVALPHLAASLSIGRVVPGDVR